MVEISAFDLQTMKYYKDRSNLTLFPTFYENIRQVSDGVCFISYHEIIHDYCKHI